MEMKNFAAVTLVALAVLVVLYLAVQSTGVYQAPSATPSPDYGGGSQVVYPSTAPSNAVHTNKVVILYSQFQPGVIDVLPGTTVTWENQDGKLHSVRSRGTAPEQFYSGTIGGRQTYNHTFTLPGKYEYYDDLTGAGTGVVYVP